MEEIREVRITIYVDTDKATYEQTFRDIDNAAEYLKRIFETAKRDVSGVRKDEK